MSSMGFNAGNDGELSATPSLRIPAVLEGCFVGDAMARDMADELAGGGYLRLVAEGCCCCCWWSGEWVDELGAVDADGLPRPPQSSCSNRMVPKMPPSLFHSCEAVEERRERPVNVLDREMTVASDGVRV